MNTQASHCEEFEIAALRRARGALEPSVTERLDAHLGACPSCRGFAATAAATESALRARARDLTDGRDWDRVRHGFHARRRLDRSRKLGGLACFAVMGVVAWWALGPATGALFVAFLVGIVAFVYWRFVLPEQRRARRAEALDADLLEFYRRDLDTEIAALRGARRLVVVLTVLGVGNLLFLIADVVKELVRGRGLPDVEKYLATFVVFALVGGVMWVRGRRVLPRLLREREELGK